MDEVTWRELARAESERGEVLLRRRSRHGASDVLQLRVDGVVVCDTLESAPEIELAEAALDLVEDPRDVVVGGLGLGSTAQQVLADPRVERVTVVEVEEALVGWVRDGTVPHGPALMADRRLRVVNADLAMAVAEARQRHDLVLLPVDHGRGFLGDGPASALGDGSFLADCRAMLNPGGVLAAWSAAPAPELAARWGRVFGDVRESTYDVLLHDRPATYHLCAARR